MRAQLSRIDLNPLLISLILFILLSTWAISSPVGSAPDESTHLTTAWCYKNFKNNECTQVPNEIYNAGKCFIYDSNQVATCQLNLSGVSVPTAVNEPSFYIKYLAYFLTNNLSESVVIMRISNAFILSVFFLLLFYFSSKKRFYINTYSFLLTSLPLGFYLIPSISTSSWLIILFSILIPLTMKIDLGYKSLFSFLFLALILVVVSNSRNETIVFVLGSFLASGIYLMNLNFVKTQKSKTIITGFLFLNSIFYFLLWQNSKLIEFRIEKISMFETLSRFQSLIIGIFGGWGLGSLEVSLPGLVFVLNFAIILAILFLSLNSKKFNYNLAISLNFMFISLLVIFTLYNSNLRVGEWLQPRYILPLFYPIIFIATYNLICFSFENLKSILKIVIPLQFLVYSFSHFELLKRYTHGSDYTSFNLNFKPKWWWSQDLINYSPMTVLSISLACFALLLILIYKNLFSKTFTQLS